MRTFRSVVAVVSTALLMACQTAAPSGMNRPLPAPVIAAHAAEGSSSVVSNVSYESRKAAAPVAAEGSRRTWLIVALLAAIAIVVAVTLLADPDSGGIY